MADNQQGVPSFNYPMVSDTGTLTTAWYRFFISIWNRTGGASPVGNVQSVSVQAANGIVASVENPTTNPIITISLSSSSIPSFTATSAGSVPASGGGTKKFLRSDGVWTSPVCANTVASVSQTGYVTIYDPNGNAIRLLTG